MLKQITLNLLFVLAVVISSNGQVNDSTKVAAFQKFLKIQLHNENDYLLSLSFESILNLISDSEPLNNAQMGYIADMADYFYDNRPEYSAANMKSYLKRRQSLIVSWYSASDGELSYAWLELPKDWNPEKTYPLYMQLHGYWDVAADKMEYMAYPYSSGPSSDEAYAFEDGYHVSPWGRGNNWYKGIGEADFWECIEEIDALLNIDNSRRYLCGHSMGGYGAWNLGQKSSMYWAAIGIHAGALWWGNDDMLSASIISNLNDVPVYFVCGDQDVLFEINQDAYNLLEEAGNEDIEFVTFEGAHDYHRRDVEGMYDWMREYTTDFASSIPEIQQEISITIGPNPFDERMSFNLQIEEKEMVQIELYSVHGQLLEVLFKRSFNAGSYQMVWETESLRSGIYFCSIQQGNKTSTQRIVKH